MTATTNTIWVRRPTAQPAGEVSAPTFRLDRPLTGLTIGLRTDRAWRSWQLIAGVWDQYLRRDGAQTISVETGAQIGQPASSDRKQIDELAEQVDAAIVGLGTCGSCTTFTIKDSVAVEEHEKPVVAIVCEEFTVHAHNVARHVGHGDLSVLVLPYPLEARPTEELEQIARDYYPKVLELLGRDGMTLASERVEVPADPRLQYERALDERWSDGVPQLPATDDAVEALLAASPYPADHVVCVLPPVNGVATVELVAINAALAGVEPAAFGYVLAALEALSEPEWNAFGLTTTTSSVFPMLIVNGPSRDDVGIDYRASCMGGAAGRGSMTIGRAVALCLRNIGGQRAGETTKSVFGQPARFGFCIGEWEERSPWPSLAQRRGFGPDDDVVTVHGGKGTMPMADIHNDDPRDLLYLIAKSMAYPLANMFLGNVENGEVVVAFNPMWAERFGAAFPDVDDLAAFLQDNAWQPIDLWPEGNAKMLRARGRVDSRDRVHLVERPDQIVPIVCGGLGSLHAIGLPSFGESTMQSKPVVRRA